MNKKFAVNLFAEEEVREASMKLCKENNTFSVGSEWI